MSLELGDMDFSRLASAEIDVHLIKRAIEFIFSDFRLAVVLDVMPSPIGGDAVSMITFFWSMDARLARRCRWKRHYGFQRLQAVRKIFHLMIS